MQRLRVIILGAIGITVAASTLAGAAVLVPVPEVPGSTTTSVYDINDNNAIVGTYYTAKNTTHGFTGTLAGDYTTFDGDDGLIASAIDNTGVINGVVNAKTKSYCNLRAFQRAIDGTISNIKKGKKDVRGFAERFNNKNSQFVGDICQIRQGTITPFVGEAGAFRRTLDIGVDSKLVHGRGINRSGTVVGFYSSADHHQHGFVLQNGETTTIDYPDADEVYTNLEAINADGIATGSWYNEDFTIQQAFLYDTNTSTFLPISVPGATATYANGINKAGLVAVQSDVGSFIYCPTKKGCPSNGIEIPDTKPIYVRPDKFLDHSPMMLGNLRPQIVRDGHLTFGE